MSSVNLKELSGIVSFAAVFCVFFVSRIPKLILTVYIYVVKNSVRIIWCSHYLVLISHSELLKVSVSKQG